MKIIDLFPDCTIDGCKEAKNGKHKHILPLQQEFLDSNERFIALVGGYGSGKTLPACIMGHILSMAIPGNMGIILRRSLPKLHDSTLRIYLEVLQRSGVSFQSREMRDGWPHRIIYPNGSEVACRETKDLGRFLGPEYGWYFLDEAQEEPEKTFRDLTGRLRLPRAHRYLRGMLATNPPPQTHWLAKKFPEPGRRVETVKIKGAKEVKLTYRMIRSSTYDNPFLSSDYVAGILENNSPAEARRIIEGFYGFQQEGRPVYPMFDFFKHVGDPPTRTMALYRVWDFGFHVPACSWHQMFKCEKGSLHWVVLNELLGEDVEATAFATQVVNETKRLFPEIMSLGGHLVLDGGDAAGAQVSDKGPGPIIILGRPVAQGGMNIRFKYKKFSDIDPGLDLVRRCLRTRCKCGYPLLMLHRRCRTLGEALAGGYHMPKERPGHGDNKKLKPVKDGYYDNIADTLRYAGELFYRPLSTLMNEDILNALEYRGRGEVNTSWEWMEAGVNSALTDKSS